MSSAVCFNLDQPKILLSGNGLADYKVTLFFIYKYSNSSPYGRPRSSYRGRRNDYGGSRHESGMLFNMYFDFLVLTLG